MVENIRLLPPTKAPLYSPFVDWYAISGHSGDEEQAVFAVMLHFDQRPLVTPKRDPGCELTLSRGSQTYKTVYYQAQSHSGQCHDTRLCAVSLWR